MVEAILVVIDPLDLRLLVLWIVSTHLALELYTTPRLLLDSSMPGSGKTTALDHMSRLTCNPVQMSAVSSSAMLVRVLENSIRPILIDEVDKSLRFDKPGVADILDDLAELVGGGHCPTRWVAHGRPQHRRTLTRRAYVVDLFMRRQRLRALVLGSACRVLHGAAGVRSA
ncbi:MAG: hypothetical protein QOE20_4542 [Mycobacterium sp.]|nr:hypothetical protein [Mycobacterium sp.]